jgi:predicted O-methyltransferase YrrM
MKVALRAGGATLAVGAVTSLIAPAIAPVVTLAAGTAVLAFELSRVQATLARQIAELESDIAQTQPLLELARELPTRLPLPLMRGYAIAPDFALMLARMIADEKPELILETGSGVSTLIAGYALQRLGRGKVIALEHQPEYAAKTRALIAQHGLSEFASVVDAPLEPIEVNGGNYRWYSTRALDGLGPIDMVIDDGPPRIAGDMLRYASLPVLSKRLSLRGTFVLDVVGPEEKIILERWRTELPAFAQEHLVTKKGNVIIRRAARTS